MGPIVRSVIRTVMKPFSTSRDGHAVPRRRPTVGLVVVAALAIAWTWSPATMAQPAPEGSPASTVASSDPMAALSEGNRLFRDGLVEAAAEAYRAGYDPDSPHPTLVYNLGTALHHLDRLPEAILWYRRGESSDDPWLEENLWLARRTLGSQILPATGVISLVNRYAGWLRLAAIVCAWIALVVLWVSPWFGAAPRRGFAVSIFIIAGALYGTAAISGSLGSRPAVLLEDCATLAGDLPAGTEVWVRRRADGAWRIAASSEEAICPAQAVAPIVGASS